MARVMGGPNPGKGEAWNMVAQGPGRVSGLWQHAQAGHMAASSQDILWLEEPNKQGNRSKLYTNWVHWAVGKISSLLLEGMERHKCFVS